MPGRLPGGVVGGVGDACAKEGITECACELMRRELNSGPSEENGGIVGGWQLLDSPKTKPIRDDGRDEEGECLFHACFMK